MEALPALYIRATDHYTVGKTIGATFKHLIHKYMKISQFTKTLQKFYNSKTGRLLFDQYLQTTSKCFPEIIRELHGIADGAELSFHEIFLLQLTSEILCVHGNEIEEVNTQENGATHCTDVLVNNKDFRMIAHNEDWDVEVKEFAYFVHVTIENEKGGEPIEEFASFVVPGELPGLTFGMNRDLVLTVNTLLPKHVNVKSVPLAFLLRKLLTCKSMEDCVKVMENKPYGCAYGINVNIASIHGDRMGTLEVYPEEGGHTKVNLMTLTSESKDTGNYFYHCNHYSHISDTKELECDRSRRIEVRANTLKPPENDDDVRRILGDTDDPTVKIYKDPSPDNTSPGSRTVATAVFNITERKLHVYKSNPGRGQVPCMTVPFL